MQKTIVNIGSSNIDLVMKMSRLPQRGESVTDAVFFQTFGGKGANQAMAAAKAGGQVHFVNCVGDDSYGEQVIQNMRGAGINTVHITVEPGVASGTALIMVGPSGENYLGVAPGANGRMRPEHIDKVKDLLAEAGMVMLQYEIPTETLEYAIHLAHEVGCPVMLNLAPARPLSAEYLAKLDYLVVNETEAAFLCGFEVNGEADAWRAADLLRAKGPGLVIITLGAAGSLVHSASRQFTMSAFSVTPVDTTAAGDVYCGCLAVALTEGRTLEDSVRFASAAAAIAVTRMGAQPSIPRRNEIDAFLGQSDLLLMKER